MHKVVQNMLCRWAIMAFDKTINFAQIVSLYDLVLLKKTLLLW